MFTFLACIARCEIYTSEFIERYLTVVSNTIFSERFLKVIRCDIGGFCITFVNKTSNAFVLSPSHEYLPEVSVPSQVSIHAIFWINSKSLLIAVTSAIYTYTDLKIAFESNLFSLKYLHLLFIISFGEWYPSILILLYYLTFLSRDFLIDEDICFFSVKLYLFQYQFLDALHLVFTVYFQLPDIIGIIWLSIIGFTCI